MPIYYSGYLCYYLKYQCGKISRKTLSLTQTHKWDFPHPTAILTNNHSHHAQTSSATRAKRWVLPCALKVCDPWLCRPKGGSAATYPTHHLRMTKWLVGWWWSFLSLTEQHLEASGVRQVWHPGEFHGGTAAFLPKYQDSSSSGMAIGHSQ